MAEATAPAPNDRDLASMAEARALARRAKQAQAELAEFSQDKIDAIVGACAEVATAHAEAFARMAVEETGFGVYEDKVQKNLFASRTVYNFIKPMKTVGVVARHEARRVVDIAEPFGVVAAIVPSTKKVGPVGARLDVPVTHVNASYVRGHFNAMEVGVSDAPRADEMVLILVMTTGGRVHDRVGGLRASEIKGEDGLR